MHFYSNNFDYVSDMSSVVLGVEGRRDNTPKFECAGNIYIILII